MIVTLHRLSELADCKPEADHGQGGANPGHQRPFGCKIAPLQRQVRPFMSELRTYIAAWNRTGCGRCVLALSGCRVRLILAHQTTPLLS